MCEKPMMGAASSETKPAAFSVVRVSATALAIPGRGLMGEWEMGEGGYEP